MSFNPREWVFYRVVDKMVRIFEVLSEGRGVQLSLSGASTAKILADERTIHIIPSAFIDNAIKYSKRGGKVEIHVSDGVRDNRLVVTCAVRSDGPPATPDEEQRLFRGRGRGEAARTMAEGTGVGLALAKVVADQHGGTVSALQRRTSLERSEWTFSCEIPVVR
jgi:signal transduction histidine kinase